MATAALDPGPEACLIESARDGDIQAFGALYDRYAKRIFGHIAFRTGNCADSEDLTQETFLKAWQAIGRYQLTGSPFVAWLLTIAHNTVISYFRAHRNHQELSDSVIKVDEHADPAESLQQQYRDEALRQAIGRLKPAQQHIVVLHFLDEVDYRDIAGVMGKSEGNVRVMAHRALRDMRKHLGDAPWLD